MYNNNNHKSTTEHTKFPAGEVSKLRDMAWSAAANAHQAERDVNNNTSWLNGTNTHTLTFNLFLNGEKIKGICSFDY